MREDWQHGPRAGTARIAVAGDTAWWVHRTLDAAGAVDDGVFETDYADVDALAGWVLRQNGRAVPLAPDALRVACAARSSVSVPLMRASRRSRPASGRRTPPPRPTARPARRAGALRGAAGAARVSPCGVRRHEGRAIPAAELTERFHIPPDELQEHLSLLNLVNFGGGCYTVYAELEGDTVRIDKELYGDVFRLPPRLTPLEARAIRLALDIVGPTIAARAHTPLDRVRKKLEDTFGQFDSAAPETRLQTDEERSCERSARRWSSTASSRSST